MDFDFSGILDMVTKLGGLGLNAYNIFANPPNVGGGQAPAPQGPPQAMPQWEPPTFEFSMPEFSPPPFDPSPYAKQLRGTRSNMQERGIYSGGAAEPNSLMNLLGVTDPDQIKQIMAYLQQQGDVNPTGSWG